MSEPVQPTEVKTESKEKAEIEADISKILFETHETGEVRALLSFKSNEELKGRNFSFLSIPIDESVTEMGQLCIAKDDKVFLVFEGNNLKYYELRRYKKQLTELPKTCAVCDSNIVKINNIQRKIKRIACVNKLCNANSRAVLFRLFAVIGVTENMAELYMNSHYTCPITHLWDLVMIHKQNDGDPNTEPRQKLWKGQDELWLIEKVLYQVLPKLEVSNENFWFICFGIEFNEPKEFNPRIKYPKVVTDNIHLISKLNKFFEAFKEQPTV